MKDTNICNSTWDRSTLDSFKHGLINLDSLSRDNIAKENYLRGEDLTLLKFNM